MTNAAYLKVIRQHKQRLQREYDRARKLLFQLQAERRPEFTANGMMAPSLAFGVRGVAITPSVSTGTGSCAHHPLAKRNERGVS